MDRHTRMLKAWGRLAQDVEAKDEAQEALSQKIQAQWDEAIQRLKDESPDMDFFMFRCLVAEAMGAIGEQPKTALNELYEMIEAEFLDGAESPRLLNSSYKGYEGDDPSDRHFDLTVHMYLRHKRKGQKLKDVREDISNETGYAKDTLKDIWKANWKHVEDFIEEHGIPNCKLPNKN